MLVTTRVLPSVRPPPSGVISHVDDAQECSWYDTMIIPHPILCFPQVRVMTYLATYVKKEERRHIYTYFHLLFFDFIFKQVITQNLNKAKLGSTLLGNGHE